MIKKILMSLAVLGAASFAQDPNLHIYLAYGQSNMSGQATVTDKDRVQDPRFLVLRAANHSNQKVGEFYPAAPPMGHSQSKVGIVDIFGRKMVKELPDSIKIAGMHTLRLIGVVILYPTIIGLLVHLLT